MSDMANIIGKTLPELSALISQQSTRIAALEEALSKARDQFLFYQQSHLAKCPPDYETEVEMVAEAISGHFSGADRAYREHVDCARAAINAWRNR